MKGKPRYRVELDNGVYLILSSVVILEFQISNKMIISEDEILLIKQRQNLIDIKQDAYNFVSYKPRTKVQVVRKLKDKGYEADQIPMAIGFLEDFGLLDDEKYAFSFISSLIAKKNLGKSRVRIELIKKGIDKDLASEIVDKHYIEDTFSLALKAAEKKMKMIMNKEPKKQKSSLIAYLSGKGFDWDDIKIVVQTILPKE